MEYCYGLAKIFWLCFTCFIGFSAATQCLVSSGEAALSTGNDALDASMFIYAASKRCGMEGQQIKCEVDVASAIRSVNSLINGVLKIYNKCEGLHGQTACGMEVGNFTKYTEGLAAAAGAIAQHCPRNAGNAKNEDHVLPTLKCTIGVKGTIKELYKAVVAIRQINTRCNGGEFVTSKETKACVVDGLHIAAALAGMGAYTSSAVGHCQRVVSSPKVINSRNALCGQAIGDLAKYAAKASESGIQLSEKCEKPLVRVSKPDDFFSIGKRDLSPQSPQPAVFLTGFLFAGIFGFLAGILVKRFAGSREADIRLPSTDDDDNALL